MRNWFPFTDYDFYGYLVSGFALLFAADYALLDGEVMLREQWTFVQGVLAVGVAYFAGQIMAFPSSVVLEHGLARKLLTPPVSMLLHQEEPRQWHRWIGHFVIGRHYQPLPDWQRRLVIQRAAKDNNTTEEAVSRTPDLVFSPAFRSARQTPDIRERIDTFRNQYGLTRNMAFAAFVSAGLFFWRAYERSEPVIWAALSVIFGIGLVVRFLKFYSAFAAELLHAYAFGAPPSKGQQR